MKKRLVFHIGLPKTGTTFLQKNVFPYIQGITYFNCIDNPKAEDSIRLNPFFLKFQPGVNLISDERICGLGYLNLPYGDMMNRIRTLHKVYPNADIIFITRDVPSLITSLYKQYAKYSYGKLQRLDWILNEMDDSIVTQQLSVIHYALKYFNRLLVLDYSMLKMDQDGFIKYITDFLGAPRLTKYNRKRLHVSPSDSAIKSIVKLNNSRLPWFIKKPIRMLWRQNK